MLPAGVAGAAPLGNEAAAPARTGIITAPMHLIVPFAGTVSEAGREALAALRLPQLARLLAQLKPLPPLGRDAFSPNPPHALALARACGWSAGPDEALPFAAAQAATLGLDATAPWALLTPVHLHLGTEQVSLTPTEALPLDAATSRALFDAVAPLFTSEGFVLHWAAPGAWLASHALFDGLATAALDRVTGRNIDPWLPDQRQARLLRRLQNEVQMLLYTHPINEAREADGLPTVNSVWVSGSGRLAAGAALQPAAGTEVDNRLAAPALAEDWAAWAAAWAALDAGPVAQLAAALPAAGDAPCLTLCGERLAQPFAPAPRGWLGRLAAGWKPADPRTVLEAL